MASSRSPTASSTSWATSVASKSSTPAALRSLWLEGLSQSLGEEGNLTALDPTIERIREGREALADAALAAPVRLVEGDVFEPPFGSQTFDLVYSAGLFHELDVRERAAEDALEALVSVVGLEEAWPRATSWIPCRPPSSRTRSTGRAGARGLGRGALRHRIAGASGRVARGVAGRRAVARLAATRSVTWRGWFSPKRA